MTTKHDESSIQDGCRKLVANEVGNCLSMLVHTLAQAYGSTVQNGPGNELAGLCEQAFELSTPILDFDEAAREAGWQHGGDFDGFWFNGADHDSWKAAASDDDAVTYETARDVCDGEQIEPHEREIYEHWAVSSWLADKLESRGERIDRDFAGLIVWGRTTTGQSILLDGVIRDIYRELHGLASE